MRMCTHPDTHTHARARARTVQQGCLPTGQHVLGAMIVLLSPFRSRPSRWAGRDDRVGDAGGECLVPL